MLDISKIKNLNIPKSPGVYFFKDKQGNVLYVGKAKNLKKRIHQYFYSNSLKIKKLLESAETIEFIETKSEAEAIFKESDLIKKLNPPFNQLLRDDSKYFYVVFTQETLPRVFVTHQIEKYQTSEIIGPFPEGQSLKTILRIVRKSIPYCTCKEKHLRPCLNSMLGLCYGWCCLKNAEIDDEKIKLYNKNLSLIKKILTGNLTELKKEILIKIEKYLKQNKIDLADNFRKIYLSLKKIEETQDLIKDKESILLEHKNRKILLLLKKIFKLEKIPHLIEAYDVSHYAGKEKVGVCVAFLDGIYQPKLLKKFKIKTVLKPDDPRMIYEVLKRRLKHKEWGIPDLILVDGGKIQFKFAKKAIQENNLNIGLIALAKPKKEVYYDLDKKIFLKDFPEIRDFILSIDQKAHQVVLKYHKNKRESLLRRLIKNQ